MDIDQYREFSPEPVRQSFLQRVQALRRDPYADMPVWVREDPANALQGSKFVICGTRLAAETRHLAQRHEVLAVVDDSLYQKEARFLGFPVISTDAWLSMAKKDPSIVSMVFVPGAAGYTHFLRCCAQHRLRWLGPLDYLRLAEPDARNLAGHGQTFVYGLGYFRHTIAHADELVATGDLFDDDFSRFTLFSLLNYRLTAESTALARCAVGYNSGRYGYNTYNFNRSFFDFSEEEVFVDGGAFNGDSMENFVRAVGGRFRRIYCFEPAADQAEKCVQRIRMLRGEFPKDIMPRTHVIQKGLWSGSTRLSFNPSLYAAEEAAQVGPWPLSGHLVESGLGANMYLPEVEQAGAMEVETTSIDESCDDPVTFVKLEIEGSELEALTGARRTIASTRPRMALSIYHKPEDLLTLTGFVRDTGLGYRLSLRQHNSLVPDATVCYCY